MSDHSPCTPDLKQPGHKDFMAAWGGISSLQVGLLMFWHLCTNLLFMFERNLLYPVWLLAGLDSSRGAPAHSSLPSQVTINLPTQVVNLNLQLACSLSYVYWPFRETIGSVAFSLFTISFVPIFPHFRLMGQSPAQLAGLQVVWHDLFANNSK